jgi:hypothetical protein
MSSHPRSQESEATTSVTNLDNTLPMKILLQNSFTLIEIYGTKPWYQVTQGAKESEATDSVTNRDDTLPMKILLQTVSSSYKSTTQILDVKPPKEPGKVKPLTLMTLCQLKYSFKMFYLHWNLWHKTSMRGAR